MLVATLGKMPRFFCLLLSFSGSSSSPVPGDATLLSKPSPGRKPKPALNNIAGNATDWEHKSEIHKKPKLKWRKSKLKKFKARGRWIHGQIPQMPMKEFQSSVVRLQQSQCCVEKIWRLGDLECLRWRPVQWVRNLDIGLAEFVYILEHRRGERTLITRLLWLDVETLGSLLENCTETRKNWSKTTTKRGGSLHIQ